MGALKFLGLSVAFSLSLGIAERSAATCEAVPVLIERDEVINKLLGQVAIWI